MSPIGVIVGSALAPTGRGTPTDTGTAFIAGRSATGAATTPVLLKSIADFETTYGVRVAGNQLTYDCVDAFFREGGRQCYVSVYDGTTKTFQNCLDSFGRELGPGQLCAPIETPGTATYLAMAQHCVANNRVALYDVANGATEAQMTTGAGQIPAAPNQDVGALFGSWVNIPPPSGVVGGSARQVPASPIIAALCARVDAGGNPNRAAAGRDFPLQYVTSFVHEPTMANRDTMLTAGVNQFGTIYGVLENYGFQTAVPQDPNNPFWQFNCSRARMWLRAQAAQRGENYVFKNIDAKGHLAGALKTDLDAVCLALYQADGLYGETPEEAFATNVGAQVNTVGQIAQGYLHAQVQAVFSLHAKAVYIDLVTIPITGNVS